MCNDNKQMDMQAAVVEQNNDLTSSDFTLIARM